MASPASVAPQTIIDLYDEIPYPNIPITQTLTGLDFNESYKVSYTTAQYARTRQIVPSEGKVLLNAGCGSGWETHILAAANPGAKIVGMDLSHESVRVAEQRLQHHGYPEAEFYTLDLLALDQLGMQFDLISCNDVIYLLDSPVEGLQALGSVLHPEGIIRTNLHHIYTRRSMLEMQEIFGILGLYEMPRRQAATHVYQLMDNLKPNLERAKVWNPKAPRRDITSLFNNFLLAGDKGFSIPETFDFLQQAGLGMVCLVDFGRWDLGSIFKEMPAYVEQKWEQLSLVEQLHLFELLTPNTHRLIDFWAEHRGSSLSFPWSEEDWLQGIIHLNPVVINSLPFHQQVHRVLEGKIRVLTVGWIAAKGQKLTFSGSVLSWLSLLLQGPQPLSALVDKRMEVGDLNRDQATDVVLSYLQALEEYLFVMLGPAEE